MKAFTIIAACAGALGAAACADTTAPEEPQPIIVSTTTVDARSAWAYVNFATEPAAVSIADAATSAAWDLGFNATAVKLNGGSNGPGGALAYCICQNANVSAAALETMTAESQLAAFEAVTLANVPANADAWSSTAFDTNKWYRYNITGNDH
ncbi:MAG: HmuY family protein, partial [Gemmatimonadota bacterium]